jgi:PII-like signaling protein
MTTQYRSGQGSSFSFFGFVLALVLGALLLGIFVHRSRTGFAGRLATLITGRSTTFDESVPVVVEKIQSLNRLESVVYSLDTVVEGSVSTPMLPDALAGDKILLVVHGQSIAGIDLSKLKPEDVQIDGQNSRSIHVNLPPSEIFVTTLDNTRTRVYARSTGLLVPADQNLESETRAKAQQQLQAAAMADGILDVARKNARASIALLLTSLGFDHVEVT